MSGQADAFRLEGGQLDRGRSLAFSWNGKQLSGFAGDTLASALLANGVRLVGRSFKYHRPRGIFSAGSEEPNALVHHREGAAGEPNTRATMLELYEGLVARSQNHRGPLEWDLLAVNDLLAPWLSAGFYYKTFMWPKSFWEKVYEPAIRSAAGLGRLSGEPDPDSYDRGFRHCDLLVIGAGPAGLAAALAGARAGARVILADEDFRFGGRLNAERLEVDGQGGADWAAAAVAELGAMPNVRLMPRTTVFGAYDHGIYGALERCTDHLPQTGGKPRQIMWRIYTRRAILAAGATERPIAFPGNDRPGIMLAGAVRAYANRWAVAAGRRVAVLTNNDDGWRTARDLAAKGVEIAAVVDTREIPPPAVIRGAALVMGAAVAETRGRKALRRVRLTNGQWIEADCLAVSGGWSPNVYLSCHQRGRPEWRENIAAFVPAGTLPPGMAVAGAARGTFGLAACLSEGRRVAEEALGDLGFTPSAAQDPATEDEPARISAFWHVEGRGRAWVDLQNDVTVKDIRLAEQEGYRAPEHVKRYTTLGMATDQGRTGNVLGLALIAEARGQSIAETGTTIFRPPYTPATLAAFAGPARGRDYRPVRRTPSHDWALEAGAKMVESGLWMRAQWYARPGETDWRESCNREVMAVREAAGVADVSTLGKIDIQGRDAGAFINRVYANGFAKLPVGRVRYGLMLREDGIVMDDGTTARLGESHYLMTTTTANAVAVYRHLDFCRQCLWPDMDVHIASVTDAWAQFSVAGPKARDVLRAVVDPHFDLSGEAFPFMACGEVSVFGGLPARLFRISFSGELGYEIAVPRPYGDSFIRALMEVGAPMGLTPYGLEALNVMRIEKGHPVAAELTGQTTARDLGLGRMVREGKDAIGTVLSRRPWLNRPDGWSLVGLRPVDRSARLSAGAHFLKRGAQAQLSQDEGWMTSVAFSPVLGHWIGLGFLAGGGERMGEVIRAWDGVRGRDVEVEVVPPQFVDPDGERMRG